jgi:NAD(P)-dependent dehydrogenase (short-subunit alcohol dehydrogenase family)
MSRRAQQDASIRAFIKTKQPLSAGFIPAEDIASGAVFLLSDEARYITGEVMTIDGGWRLSR